MNLHRYLPFRPPTPEPRISPEEEKQQVRSQQLQLRKRLYALITQTDVLRRKPS